MKEPGVDNGPMRGHETGCGFLSTPELEAAIEGTLSAERRFEFERHFEDCSACLLLAADLETFSTLVAEGAIDGERRESDRQAEMLRVRLRRQLAPQESATPRRQTQWRAYVAVAATVVLAFAAWYTLRGPNAATVVLPGGEKFVIEVEPLGAPPVLRDEQSLLGLWRQAESAFNKQRFAEAERVLAEIEDASPDAVDATLYRGVCLLMLNRASEARAVLARARAAAESQDMATASISWYEALAALADDDLQAARLALERVREAGGSYAVKAEDLLSRLNP